MVDSNVRALLRHLCVGRTRLHVTCKYLLQSYCDAHLQAKPVGEPGTDLRTVGRFLARVAR